MIILQLRSLFAVHRNGKAFRNRGAINGLYF